MPPTPLPIKFVPDRKPTSVERIEVLEEWKEIASADIQTIKDNTQIIVDIIGGTKKFGPVLSKYGPRLLWFATGIALSLGWIDAETVATLKGYFGF